MHQSKFTYSIIKYLEQTTLQELFYPSSPYKKHDDKVSTPNNFVNTKENLHKHNQMSKFQITLFPDFLIRIKDLHILY
jgi:hypothetical protein